jgi:hypothetical protein
MKKDEPASTKPRPYSTAHLQSASRIRSQVCGRGEAQRTINTGTRRGTATIKGAQATTRSSKHHKVGIQRFGRGEASGMHSALALHAHVTAPRPHALPNAPIPRPPFASCTPTTLIPHRVQGRQAKFTLISRSRGRCEPATRRRDTFLHQGRRSGASGGTRSGCRWHGGGSQQRAAPSQKSSAEAKHVHP